MRVEIMTIPGAEIKGVNPLPKFRERDIRLPKCGKSMTDELKKDLGACVKVLPYLVQDRYSREKTPLKIKTCVLENKYLKAVFMPEYGGRLYSLYDKVHKRDLVMKNPVIQPGNLAIRNAWLSGGIEWNIGSLGHTYTTCDNVFAARMSDGGGNEFLRIYEFERCTNVFWQVDFHLPEDSEQLFAHVKIINPFNEDTTTYWWTNIAVEDRGKTRILCSSEEAVFTNSLLEYGRLPYTDGMPGIDISYPGNISKSFEYFFQPKDNDDTAWEAAAYEDGTVFYECSTAPLLYRKLFCWGNHRGGKHWQEFLSQKGSGYYAEIQSGIARTQLHDKIMRAGTQLEWTQCFGGMKLDKNALHGVELHDANKYLDEKINIRSQIIDIDKKMKCAACMEVQPDSIIHNGSGWGALESMRMETEHDSEVPKSMFFPKSTMDKMQYPWVYLLEHGIMPDESPDKIPDSWLTSSKWLKLMEKGIKNAGGKTWYSLLHYGTALYEQTDNGKIAAETINWAAKAEFEEKAEKAWLESVNLCPSVWAYRNLAVMQKKAEDSERFYDKAFELKTAACDFSIAVEYIDLLCKIKKYQKAWELYLSLPKSIQTADRIMISVSVAASELKKTAFLEEFFRHEHFAVREGERTLTDVWFKYNAILLAEKNNIINPTAKQLKEFETAAKIDCPPPEYIDFRMTLGENEKYRMEG